MIKKMSQYRFRSRLSLEKNKNEKNINESLNTAFAVD